MSRRKQAKPQHVQSNALHLDNMDGDCVSVGAPGPHACGRCCEEFAARSDLEEHERNCSPNPVVVIVNENDDLSFLSHHGFFAAASSAGTAGREAEGANNSVTTESSVLEDAMDCSKSTGCHGDFNGTCYTRGCPAKTDTDFCATDFSPSLLQSGSSSEQEQDFLWMDGNVIIENLESTKVAVAQFLQQTPPGVRQNGNHKRSVSSLLEQLLALQMQQIHQLRLIDQIRHQVLVLAAQRAETPGTAAGCGRDLSSSKSIDRLTELSSNLSKQLAVAAGAAQCLAYQSANMGDFRKITTAERQRPSYLDGERVFSSDPLRSLGKLVTSAIHNQLSKTQYMYSGGPHPQLNVLSQTKISSLAISTDSFINKSTNNLHFIQPQSTSKLQMNYNQMLKIGAVVEDLDALAALAQKRKCDAAGLTETKISSKDAFFKHKCRFCAKLFGSDSALKIHLRSHTGERPYKCNICANRFSTRGNLKVHFQRHKQRYPHIQMNPYPVPEHLDNVPTSTGIPYGMSMQPEKIVTRWIHSKPPQTAITASSSSVLLGSTKQHALIKREAHSDLASAPCNQGLLHFDPTIKPKNTGHPAGTGHDSMTAMNRKNEEKTSLSVVFKMMTTKLEESKERSPDDVLFRHANSDSAQGIQRLKSSETSKLQQLVEQIDGKGSDANECVGCRRSLSCRSALRMHYRTHTGERPYPCKLCGRAFSTKGNLKTHQAVHPAALPPGAQRSCPICQRKFTDAPALQQHVRLHLVGQISRAAGSSEDAPRPAKRSEGFTDNENSIELMDFSDNDDDDEDEEDDEGDDEGSGECGPSQFESLPSSLSSSVSDMSFSEAPDATSCCQRNEGLRYNFIKIERENRATGEGCLTYNPTSAEDRYGGEPAFSEGLAPERSFSTHSLSLYDLNSEKPFPAQASAAPSQLRERCTAPSDLKLYNPKDPPSPVHCFREKGTFRHTACDICGKNFACQSALDIHYRSHTKERPFICTACNRGFTTKGNLKQHMLTHQMRDLPSQLFEAAHPNRAPNAACSVLSLGPSAFKAEASAHPHTPAGNGRVPSVISWSSSFPAAAAAAAAYSSSSSSPSSAAVPARRAAKQHRCRTCGKTFSSSSALQIHDRTHTGEKPFACTVCRRAFTTKGNLKVHMGTHMWNSAPSRRGRRLCVDGPPVPVGSSSAARLPAPPHRKPATTSRPDDSVLGWAPRAGPLSGPPNADDTLVTHSREVPYFFGRTGPGAQHPAEERGVGPGEARHTDRPDSLAAGGRDRNERGV